MEIEKWCWSYDGMELDPTGIYVFYDDYQEEVDKLEIEIEMLYDRIEELNNDLWERE